MAQHFGGFASKRKKSIVTPIFLLAQHYLTQPFFFSFSFFKSIVILQVLDFLEAYLYTWGVLEPLKFFGRGSLETFFFVMD